MNENDELIKEFEFPACPDQLSAIRAVVAAFSKETGFEQETIDNITLAITEAFTNIIRHGYDNCESGRIILQMERQNNPDGLKIVLRDYGKQVEPCQICSRDLEDIRPGGLGVHIIKTLMNSVKYEKAEDKGMKLTMIKYK